MAINSLFDPNRKKRIQEGLKSGRLELTRKGAAARDVSEDTPTELFTRPDSSGPDDLLPPSMQPLPSPHAAPPIKRAIEKPPRQQNAFSRMSPKVDGPMGGQGAQVRDIRIPHPPDTPEQAFQKAVDVALFNAIRAGDYSAAKDAIDRGADVNTLDPSGIFGDGNPEDTVLFSLETPLALAKRLGHKGIEDLLKRNGAKK